MTVQPEAPPIPPNGGALNPPMFPPGTPPPGMADLLADQPSGAPPRKPETVAEVGQAMAKATSTPPPTMKDPQYTEVALPGGYISPEGLLVQTAQVRELNGYDEERMSRVSQSNVAIYLTELLLLGVEDLGGAKPDKKTIQSLLIGDRDALMLGIRQATYGNEVEFRLKCTACDKDSEVTVLIDEDVPVTKLEDPLKRDFEIALRNGGHARVTLLTGAAQEAFSEGIEKRTSAEINTVMLAKSVVAINGMPVSGRTDDVLRLSSADRGTITDFIAEHQPGPQLNKEIPVPCAVCGEKYPVLLGLPNLFRF